MKLPVVMPSNLVAMVERLEPEYPGRCGCLFSPDGWINPRGVPFALDNGRFSVYLRGAEWNIRDYRKMIRRALSLNYPPLWAIVPDVVADAEATFQEWRKWHPRLARFNWPLAMAMQDGMTPEMVKKIEPTPDLIFVGGSTEWKWRTLKNWCINFPRVHVGRVNTGKLLWVAHRCGAESTDGTGWWHKKQYEQLKRYLARSGAGKEERNYRGLLY